MLETQNLTKRFKSKTAVSDVNLYLDAGESVGLLGPNGAGKSTTISMISSLLSPTSGEITLHGKSIKSNPNQLRKVLGVVPQEIALYEQLTALENLKFFGRAYGLKGKQLMKRCEQALEIVGLDKRKNELVKTYSGGMKRRTNIAVALIHEPEIVIMDEPTVGIDPQSRNHILETVRVLNREKNVTVLYTSHYMEEVEQLCERVYIMDEGRIVASGTKDELLRILSGEETVLLSLEEVTTPLISSIQEIKGVQYIEEVDEGVKIIVKKGSRVLSPVAQCTEQHELAIINIEVQTPSLEDVFLHLTGRKLRD